MSVARHEVAEVKIDLEEQHYVHYQYSNIKTEELDIKEEPYSPSQQSDDDDDDDEHHHQLNIKIEEVDYNKEKRDSPSPQNDEEHHYNINFETGDIEIKKDRYSVVPSTSGRRNDKYKCGICHKTYLQELKFKRHFKHNHNTTGLYNCEICLKIFSTISKFKDHQKTHRGEKVYKRDNRHKRFSNAEQMKKHIISKDEGTNAICHNEFKSKASLTRHVREKQFECDICHKNFFQKCQLTAHNKRMHVGKTQFECDVCHKQFSSSFQFFKKHQLVAHNMQEHVGKKQFECDICQKLYNCNNTLKLHMLTHTSERRYKCRLCHIRFAHTPSLVRHIITMHAIK